jgi:xylulokinase
MADVFNAEVVTLKVAEGAAFGAALQALWCWRRESGDAVPIESITDSMVRLNTAETAVPGKAVAAYQELQALQDAAGLALRPFFKAHRAFVSR